MTNKQSNRDRAIEGYRLVEEGRFEEALAGVSPHLKAYIGGNVLGREEWMGFARMFMTAFPDGRHVWEAAEEAGDYVMLHGHFTGTHRGAFMGIPASGNTVKFSVTMFDKAIDGKLVEHRGDLDSAALMQQISPEPGNRALVERFIAIVDSQDWEATRAYVAPDCQVQIGSFRGDREAWMAMGKAFYAGFPDGKNTIERVVASGDSVVMFGTWSGTHRGEFQGIPATDKQVRFSQTHLYRVVDGKIVEHRGEFDAAGLMQQLA